MKRFSAGNLRKLPKLDATGNPVVPGWYYWDVWTAAVHVTKRKGRLQVCPPGGVHVDVTANLAGELTPISEEQQLAWAERFASKDSVGPKPTSQKRFVICWRKSNNGQESLGVHQGT